MEKKSKFLTITYDRNPEADGRINIHDLVLHTIKKEETSHGMITRFFMRYPLSTPFMVGCFPIPIIQESYRLKGMEEPKKLAIKRLEDASEDFRSALIAIQVIYDLAFVTSRKFFHKQTRLFMLSSGPGVMLYLTGKVVLTSALGLPSGKLLSTSLNRNKQELAKLGVTESDIAESIASLRSRPQKAK